MKNKTEQGNYLDYIPVKNAAHDSKTDEAGNVIIIIENKGFFNRAAQLIFKKPRFSQVHLEEMGNFIWPLIDGKNTIYDIAQNVQRHFGKRAEPLYDRLIRYLKTMEDYDFIRITKAEAVSELSDCQ